LLADHFGKTPQAILTVPTTDVLRIAETAFTDRKPVAK